MSKDIISAETVSAFEKKLFEEEKSLVTVSKYIRDVKKFIQYILDIREDETVKGSNAKENVTKLCISKEVAAEERITKQKISKESVIQYKNFLKENYAAASVNSMLAAINAYFRFLNCKELCVRQLKIQKKPYCSTKKELTKEEYFRILYKARNTNQERLAMILQTICGTGIRVSELEYFTVEAVQVGEVSVNCKNKTRSILIPQKLRVGLQRYAKKMGIKTGHIFITKNGKPMNRSNIWREMKAVCKCAGVSREKVFPHNLRKLFARCYYGMKKDIAKLADILGHSNINTTRIYIMTSGYEHRREIEKLDLIL